ncbi:MAG: NADPH-dependent glutamate synthase, partial [Planctomycetota bacterium]|nr:NADPH-dependent glutamate synthase [Planctomycetota bacterium]
ENVYRLVVAAPRIAQARQPGQFVIVRSAEGRERIPLTIADADAKAGTIVLIIQAVGTGTREIVDIPVGGSLRDVAGPLGKHTEIEKFGRVVCVGGGVGTAVLYPLAKALAEAGNEVITLIGGRSAPYVILKDDLAVFSSQVLVTTEDGSLGEKGLITAPLGKLLADESQRPAAVFAVGPVMMMAAIAEQTRPYKVKTIVSLNPIMVDGTGMCGGCRVTVGGKILFACVDGPEFDGHLVDFKELSSRQRAYGENRHLAEPAAVHCDDHCHLEEQIAVLEALPADLTPKARMAIPRTSMPEQAAGPRSRNFKEVNLGLAEAAAVREAARCLSCKTRPCIEGCPVRVRIPEFLEHLAAGNFRAAADILRADNALPATTGRVCPQEVQCESLCVRGKKGEAVAVGWLERFVADWDAANPSEPALPPRKGQSVAVVGSGPGGLTAAGELARLGYDVTILEALHDAGGVLRYGIPEFRLPKAIVDREVDNLKKLGVDIQCNVVVGKTLTIGQIMEQYDACFVANGAGLPVFLNVRGENLKGVYSANEYLTRVNLMGAYKPDSRTPVVRGKNVVVFGGGHTAMDGVRTARRLGASRAILAYRRSRAEMPARLEEVRHAEQEGIEFMFLVNPLEILGDEKGWVRAVRMQRMELGEPDASGRRRPVPVQGSEFELPAEVAIVAIGTSANPLLTATCTGLKVNKWGNIEVDADQMTSLPGVFAGGDIVRGGATVILAMGDGKRAAQAIDKYLAGKVPAGAAR